MHNDIELFPVVILAGGLATRLYPLTEKIPKSLLCFNGEPFIMHQLKLLQKKGIRKVIICAGYLGEQIVAAVGNGEKLGIKILYAYDGEMLLGTGGALKNACGQAGKNFFVLYGDSWLDCDYRKIQIAFVQCKKPALMTVYRNENQGDISNVELSAEGKMLCYDKKNPTARMKYIDYGLGIFSASIFDDMPTGKNDLARIYQSLLLQGQLASFEVHEKFYEVGSIAGIKAFALQTGYFFGE
jgi:NDP-sugar pyrophosphorylase family protein